MFSVMIGRYLPFLVGFSREDVRRLFPYIEKNVWEILRESGYFHIQATKPDTAGGNMHNHRTHSQLQMATRSKVKTKSLFNRNHWRLG